MKTLDSSTPTSPEPFKSIFERFAEKPDSLGGIKESTKMYLTPISSKEDLERAISMAEESSSPVKSKSVFISVTVLENKLKKAKAFCNYEEDEYV